MDTDVVTHAADFGSKYIEKGRPDENTKLIKRLSKVESEGNRFILARIPLSDVDGEQNLQRSAGDSPNSPKVAQLSGDLKSNTLTNAIRRSDGGEEDPHLAASLNIPGKDNGFDIEGLAIAGERVFVGLRGPVLRGWSVILELAPDLGDQSELKLKNIGAAGRPYNKHFLDLNGLGVRELCLDGDDLLVLAGPTMNLDGPTVVYRWKEISRFKEESFVRAPDLKPILEIPFGHGTDHAEGFTIVPGTGLPRRILVVYDSPSQERLKDGEGTVRVDVFDLPA